MKTPRETAMAIEAQRESLMDPRLGEIDSARELLQLAQAYLDLRTVLETLADRTCECTEERTCAGCVAKAVLQ